MTAMADRPVFGSVLSMTGYFRTCRRNTMETYGGSEVEVIIRFLENHLPCVTQALASSTVPKIFTGVSTMVALMNVATVFQIDGEVAT